MVQRRPAVAGADQPAVRRAAGRADAGRRQKRHHQLGRFEEPGLARERPRRRRGEGRGRGRRRRRGTGRRVAPGAGPVVLRRRPRGRPRGVLSARQVGPVLLTVEPRLQPVHHLRHRHPHGHHTRRTGRRACHRHVGRLADRPRHPGREFTGHQVSRPAALAGPLQPRGRGVRRTFPRTRRLEARVRREVAAERDPERAALRRRRRGRADGRVRRDRPHAAAAPRLYRQVRVPGVHPPPARNDHRPPRRRLPWLPGDARRPRQPERQGRPPRLRHATHAGSRHGRRRDARRGELPLPARRGVQLPHRLDRRRRRDCRVRRVPGAGARGPGPRGGDHRPERRRNRPARRRLTQSRWRRRGRLRPHRVDPSAPHRRDAAGRAGAEEVPRRQELPPGHRSERPDRPRLQGLGEALDAQDQDRRRRQARARYGDRVLARSDRQLHDPDGQRRQVEGAAGQDRAPGPTGRANEAGAKPGRTRRAGEAAPGRSRPATEQGTTPAAATPARQRREEVARR